MINEQEDKSIECPFCEGRVLVGSAFVLHSMPPCVRLLAADDALDFLIQANAEFAAKELRS